MDSRRLIVALLAGFLCSLSTVASADPRPFVFSNDTYPMGKGDWEYEQWVTWRTHTEDNSDYTRIDFRHEFEFGLADNFDLAFYLPSWRYEDTEDFSGTKFSSVDIEAIVYLSNPVTDPVGLGLYGEVKIGEESLGFENKLLVQKDIGKWVFLYNLVLETEIEGVFTSGGDDEGDGGELPGEGEVEEDEEEGTEVEGELAHTLGVAYAAAPGWFIGAEMVIESEFENWSEYEHTTIYAGPSISYQRSEPFWLTVTPTYQLTDNEEAADWQVRMILGIQF